MTVQKELKVANDIIGWAIVGLFAILSSLPVVGFFMLIAQRVS